LLKQTFFFLNHKQCCGAATFDTDPDPPFRFDPIRIHLSDLIGIRIRIPIRILPHIFHMLKVKRYEFFSVTEKEQKDF
jgi:hypothetical protein